MTHHKGKICACGAPPSQWTVTPGHGDASPVTCNACGICVGTWAQHKAAMVRALIVGATRALKDEPVAKASQTLGNAKKPETHAARTPVQGIRTGIRPARQSPKPAVHALQEQLSLF